MCNTPAPGSKFNRVYSAVPGTVFANPTDVGYFPDYDTYALVPPSTTGTQATSNCARMGAPVFPPSTVAAIRQNCIGNGNGATSGNLNAIAPSRQPGGAMVNVRRETPNEKAFSGMVLTLSVTNGAGTAQVVPIGDFCKSYELGASLPTLPNTVVIGGTAGTNTLAYLKARSGTIPFRVDGVQFVASNVSFYANGKFAYIKTYPDLTNSQSQFNLSSLQNSYDNNPLVQQLPTSEIVATNTLYLLTVPAGITVTLNIGVKSEVDANDYRLING